MNAILCTNLSAREAIDVSIYEHHLKRSSKSEYFLEISSFHPILDIEAPHLYISCTKLCSILTAKETTKSSKSEPILGGTKIAHTLMIKYIINRIGIVQGEDGRPLIPFCIELSKLSDDDDNDRVGLFLDSRPIEFSHALKPKRHRYILSIKMNQTHHSLFYFITVI